MLACVHHSQLDMKYLHLTFLLCFFQLVHLHSVLCKQTSRNLYTDRDALLSFKSHITDPKKFLSNWTSNSNSSSPCTWLGVSCSKLRSRVLSLSLPGLALSGELPIHLSNLSFLHYLDLSNNSFHGTIPPQLSHLRRLQILDLSMNILTGYLPPQLANLSSLTSLSIASNQLVGKIPSELGNLRNLSYLQLSVNHFSGEFPLSIFNISSLDFLSVTSNNLSGRLPQHIGRSYSLPNIRELYLAINKFRGVIPSSISNASRLEQLDLSDNDFHGWVPLFINTDKLIQLNLGFNPLSSVTLLNSQLFDSLGNSTQLQALKLNNNGLTGELPSSVANLSINLQHFCVSGNSLTGRIPLGIGKLKNLETLSLENNYFTGEIPEDIGALDKLVHLIAHHNRLSGEIPDILGNFTRLNKLVLSYNRFRGRMPMSIGQCKQLNVLDIGMNRLHGTIPKEIFDISGLYVLYIPGNALQGSLPYEVSSLKLLQTLDISSNQFSGSIPEGIRGCVGLQWLIMARNHFSGSIPDSLGKLESLETLDLSSNELSGKIPESLEKLRYLVNLNLSFNHLEGEVPKKGVFTNLTQVALQGNTKLCSLNNEIAHELGISLCINKKKRSLLVPITLATVGATALSVSILYLFWVVMSQGKKKSKQKITSLSRDPLKGVPETISYGDIKTATNNFVVENLIGRGGFGCVYKGVFKISTGEATLAVKVLDLKHSQASKSFNAECEALRIVRHRNLVKVITSCSSLDHKGDEFKALVMQFMPNDSLDMWLYPLDEEETETSLNLMQRLNIAIDVASALEYLHDGCDPPVVHCDLKPSNVLLDENMVAHVGDFGLARLLSKNPSQSSTLGIKGSIGYIAPEYGVGGKASTLGDVYSFGILLLEMFIAKRPTHEIFKDGLSLHKLASSIVDGIDQVRKVVDPRLFKDHTYSSTGLSTGYCTSEGNSMVSYNNNDSYYCGKAVECIGAMLEVGLHCAAEEAKDRINMTEASRKLHGIRHSMLAL